MEAKQLLIHGRVQGVYYRAWTMETATGLGLKGWVRNRSDGSVEALIIGESSKISAMIAACRTGPPSANVTHIDIADASPENLERFEQRATI